MKADKNNDLKDKSNQVQLFVASMYFFIPIEKVCRKYQNAFKNSRSEIQAPEYIQNAGFVCNYLDLCTSSLLQTQDFYFNLEEDNVDGHRSIPQRKITLHPYLFHYNPDRTKKRGVFYLVIGTSINKKFSDSQPNDFCSESDLVMLRQALLKSDNNGGYYPACDPTIHHRKWLTDLVSEIEGRKLSENRKKQISFFNSITEISTVSIKNYSNDLEKEFSAEYFSDICDKEYITKDDIRFCYGILTGNDNYKRLPEDEITSILNKGYSNNMTERTFAVPGSIIFIKKHHPFPKAISKEVTPEHLIFTQYIHEMCGCLYINQQLKSMRKLFESGRPEEIKNGLSIMGDIVGTKLFRITEAAHRTEYIYNAFGLKDEYERLKDRGSFLADSLDIKYSKRSNISIIVLTILTVFIGIIQILSSQNSGENTLKGSPHITTFTNMQTTEHTLIIILLILILLCITILTCFIVLHTSRIRKKNEELF